MLRRGTQCWGGIGAWLVVNVPIIRCLKIVWGSFLAHKGCLFVPMALVPMVLHEFHDARGHFGVNHTYAMIAEQYYWPRMGDAVHRHCQHCDICLRNKSNTRKLAGLYQPLPVP